MRSNYNGTPILTTGTLNLNTGNHKYFNALENTPDGTIVLFQVQVYNAKPKFLVAIGAGNPEGYKSKKASETTFLYHDQSGREIGNAIKILVDKNTKETYQNIRGMTGKTVISSYVYK